MTCQLSPVEIEAGMAARRERGDLIDKYSGVNVAVALNYPSMRAFEADRLKGVIPTPDGVSNGFPYWRWATIEKFRGERP